MAQPSKSRPRLSLKLAPITDGYQAYSCTDQGNAEVFITEYKDTLRYDHGRKRWLVWRGHWWEAAKGGEIHRLNMQLIQKREKWARALTDPIQIATHVKWLNTTKNGRHLDEIILRARNFLPLAVDGDSWDKDPMLFAVANGVIDLTTGKLRDGKPDDLITLHSPVHYDPDACCPASDSFFNEIFLGRKDLIHFIFKGLGYSLTGRINEQCFFVLHESGSNGKSTFITIISYILGDYSKSTPSETLVAKKSGGPRNDIARLAGSRFVSSVENSLQEEAAEELIKRITGTDVVVARFLNNEFFEFVPQFKIWMACNDRPVIKGADIAIWRRIHNIPFDRHFTKAERDQSMGDKLQAEASGILARMVQGCLAWQREGLEPPDSVRIATEEYQRTSNPLTEFIDERCVLGDLFTIPKETLHLAYLQYCHTYREKPVSKKQFGIYMKAKGFTDGRKTLERWWSGVQLASNGDPEVED